MRGEGILLHSAVLGAKWAIGHAFLGLAGTGNRACFLGFVGKRKEEGIHCMVLVIRCIRVVYTGWTIGLCLSY